MGWWLGEAVDSEIRLELSCSFQNYTPVLQTVSINESNDLTFRMSVTH